MDKRDIQAVIDRARAKASIQKEAAKRRAEALAKAAEEAKQAVFKERINRFLTDHLEDAVTRALVSEQSMAILFEGEETDEAFAQALCTEITNAGYRAAVSPRSEPSGKIGYGRGDDFVTTLCVYVYIDP